MALLTSKGGWRVVVTAIACASALLFPKVGAAGDLAPGDELPPLELKAWDGTVTVLDPTATHVTVLETWASWCAPCRSALPRLAALANEFRDERVRVAAIGVDRDRSAADRFLESLVPGASLPLYHDPEGEIPARLGSPGMPSTVFAVDGVVRSVDVGFSEEAWARLLLRIRDALASSDASVSDSPPDPR